VHTCVILLCLDEKAKDLLGLIGQVAHDGVEVFYNETIAGKLEKEVCV
jgi:hypothetical protein